MNRKTRMRMGDISFILFAVSLFVTAVAALLAPFIGFAVTGVIVHIAFYIAVITALLCVYLHW